MRKKEIVLSLACCFLLAGTAGAEENGSFLSDVIQCRSGEIRIEAEVIEPEEIRKGTLESVPFPREIAERLKLLYGEEEGWETSEEEGMLEIEYRGEGFGETSSISGCVYENSISFDIKAGEAEYEAVLEKASRMEPEEILRLLELDAEIMNCNRVSNEIIEFEFWNGLERIQGVPAAFYSPVFAKCSFCYENGGLTDFWYQGNYQIAESEPATVISPEQALEWVKRYADAQYIDPDTKDRTVREMELCYYLEETEGTAAFRPVWVFRLGETEYFQERTDYIYVDAQDGMLVRYVEG